MSEMTPVAVEGALACDYAGETAIGLLDALIDAMTFSKAGVDAERTATELARLADGAGYVAQELEALVSAAPLLTTISETPRDGDDVPARRRAAGR